ncbi:seryl-tRNA synthetase [Rhizoctonia solani]|uniref:serine--tRNA ligase n=1 Tax=Rhizoctonia solani TaxID=456999 RepID=A0A0K6GA97_9AGAM|nr:seryl-tRNA synthetase [Rhizoctonia solani]
MSIPLRPWGASRTLLARHYSTKLASPKRSTSSGSLPPPKLNYEDLTHADQASNAKSRNVILPEQTFSALRRDLEAWKSTTRGVDELRTKQSHIGEAVRTAATPGDKQHAIRKARTLRDSVHAHERELSRLEKSLLAHGLRIPNTSHPNVPLGPETNARVISTHGPALIPADSKRDHNELNNLPGMKFFDRDVGVMSSGAGFAYLRGGGALLEIALVAYAMLVAVKRGFEPIVTPDVVRRDMADRCGFVPRDQEVKDEEDTEIKTPEQMYGLHSKHEDGESGLVLAGTSEIPLAAMHAQALYNPQTLPRRTVAVGHAFRAEAGARGKDTRGLYRVHQFTKVELFSVTTGEATKRVDDQTTLQMNTNKASDHELEFLRELQIELYTGLGIPFRVLDMPSEELGASAHRKYDIEAWMPGRGAWGEISSASNCTDYQARRLHIRHRHPHDDASASGPLPYAHTLNGTAAAIPRLIIALVENGVRFKEGGGLECLVLPSVLQKHWVGGDRFGEIEIRWE